MPSLKNSLGLRAALLSLLIFAGIVVLWQIATQPTMGTGPAVDPEYAKLVGAAAATGTKSAMPTPADIGATIWKHLSDPFYVRGSNDKGIGIQLAYSLGRVLLGFALAALVAVPLAGRLLGALDWPLLLLVAWTALSMRLRTACLISLASASLSAKKRNVSSGSNSRQS